MGSGDILREYRQGSRAITEKFDIYAAMEME